MRKNSFLLVTVCAMAMVLMAGRCSDDEKKEEAKSAVPSTENMPGALAPDDDTLKNPEGGVEKDPLGETIGGPGDPAAPGDDLLPPAGDDGAMLDDPTFEPEPVPDEATDL